MIEYILNLIYPPKCGICGNTSKEFLCNKCKLKLKEYELKNKKIKVLSKNKERYIDEIYSIFEYKELIRELILNYKFNNKPYLYKTFSKIILNNEKICGFLKSYDIIIPVPIHKKKRRKRGYNQTELIAKEITKKLDIKVESNVLIKKINTRSQSELSKSDRKNNIKGVFNVIKQERIINKNIIIFDDIYTTGSTVLECAKILKEAGANKIGVLAIAKD